MTRMLDRSEAIARGDAPPPPIAQLIGFDLISDSEVSKLKEDERALY